jgi:hypothetical protein
MFNYNLVLSQGHTLIVQNRHFDPEQMRQSVERKIKMTEPLAQVQFLDLDSEQTITLAQVKEIGEYSLLITAEAPILSGRLH